MNSNVDTWNISTVQYTNATATDLYMLSVSTLLYTLL